MSRRLVYTNFISLNNNLYVINSPNFKLGKDYIDFLNFSPFRNTHVELVFIATTS